MDDIGNAKIKIRVGKIELEYEGSHEFLKDGLSGLLQEIGTLADVSDFEDVATDLAEPMTAEIPAVTPGNKLALSANSIATHYGSKSASDLALCAIYQLQLVQGNDTCSRDDVMKVMKSATNFYKKSMRGTNLSSAFKTLVNQKKINELADEKYALTAQTKQAAEVELAGIG
ncbi:MAG: hypothetical protein ABJV68_23445 [Paracoccaceae bacterium]